MPGNPAQAASAAIHTLLQHNFAQTVKPVKPVVVAILASVLEHLTLWWFKFISRLTFQLATSPPDPAVSGDFGVDARWSGCLCSCLVFLFSA